MRQYRSPPATTVTAEDPTMKIGAFLRSVACFMNVAPASPVAWTDGSMKKKKSQALPTQNTPDTMCRIRKTIT